VSGKSSTGAPRRSTGGRSLGIAASVLLLLLVIGWIWSISLATAHARAREAGTSAATTAITTALTNPGAPSAAYLTEAALTAIADRALAAQRGVSGKLRVAIQRTPQRIRAESLPPGASLRYSQGGHEVGAPAGAGLWNILLTVGNSIRPVSYFNVIALHPFGEKKGGHLGLYFLGTWPSERGAVGPSKAPPGAYANPIGFIEVTRANRSTHISDHFTLADFLTHDQPNVWPKYLVLQPRLVDKLELVLTDLQEHGVDVRGMRVMSGFRTPQYNVGGGNVGGRAGLSRHMYGDAADVYIDTNGDGQMDDLNHDGRISIADARVILAAVDRVEARHPELVGGAGVYTAASGHGPFIHIDTRGYRARWAGTSGG
jgi:hypothetical protein